MLSKSFRVCHHLKAINEAYETLSDVNERSWYDNHKDQILRGSDFSKDDVELKTYGFNIWQYFNSSSFSGFEESNPKNFYSVFRDVFTKIKSEEIPFDENNDLPGFGDSKTNLDKVFDFYERWTNFTTEKTFGWVEQYNPNDGENRYEKRFIEKENKKLRDVEKKKYIKTIRELVEFAKKKDLRLKLYQEQKKKEEEIKL